MEMEVAVKIYMMKIQILAGRIQNIKIKYKLVERERDESESRPSAVMAPQGPGGGALPERRAPTYMCWRNEGKGCHGEHATHMMRSIENFEWDYARGRVSRPEGTPT